MDNPFSTSHLLNSAPTELCAHTFLTKSIYYRARLPFCATKLQKNNRHAKNFHAFLLQAPSLKRSKKYGPLCIIAQRAIPIDLKFSVYFTSSKTTLTDYQCVSTGCCTHVAKTEITIDNQHVTKSLQRYIFLPKQPKENTEKFTNLMIFLECLTAIPCSSNN